jgi:hypothetical protein
MRLKRCGASSGATEGVDGKFLLKNFQAEGGVFFPPAARGLTPRGYFAKCEFGAALVSWHGFVGAYLSGDEGGQGFAFRGECFEFGI